MKMAGFIFGEYEMLVVKHTLLSSQKRRKQNRLMSLHSVVPTLPPGDILLQLELNV